MAGIKDIAAMADVSSATVSRYFSAPEQVSKKTREKVKKVIDEVGYRPNQMGASLRTRKSRNIVVIMPEISKPVNSAIIRTLEHEAQKFGYSVLLGDTQGLRERELHYGSLVKYGQADGILLFSGRLPFDDKEYRGPGESLPPLVNVNEMATTDMDIDRVCIDNEAAAIVVMEHLFSLGHKSIAAITGPPDTPSTQARLMGYKKALISHQIDIDERMIFVGDYSLKSGKEATKMLLDLAEIPTAVFAFNDDMAISCMKSLKNAGLAVPQDISVVGFDDTTYAEYVTPSLTTIHQPLEDIGRKCVNALIRCIENPGSHTEQLLLDFTLKLRGSTGQIS